MSATSRAGGAIAAALVLSLLPSLATADQPVPATVADYPIVLELFTSEGCNSCSPADALLGHIDYWNYLGWKDPYSSKSATARQSAYGLVLDVMVYTPQMVVDGARDAIGSDEAAVKLAIEAERARPKLKLAVLRDERGELKVAIPTGEGQSAPSSVYEALFDSSHVTPVGRGENSGRTLTEFNIVREWREIGEWTGNATELSLDLEPRSNTFDACAIIVQEGNNGPVRGATAFRLRSSAVARPALDVGVVEVAPVPVAPCRSGGGCAGSPRSHCAT